MAVVSARKASKANRLTAQSAAHPESNGPHRMSEKAPTPTKAFLLMFESDESTRWLYSDEDVASMLKVLGNSAAHYNTEGAAPAVEVVPVTLTVVELLDYLRLLKKFSGS